MKLKDAVDAAKAFRSTTKGDTVSEDLIVARARICEKCRMNRVATGLPQRVSKWLGNLANSRIAPRELTDRVCGVCKCSLMLLIPAQDKDQHKDSPKQDRKRPITCWMKTPPTI